MTTTAAKSLFKDVYFYLSHSLPPEQCDHLRQMLTLNDAHDAKHDSSALTHFITNSLPNTDSLEYTAERDGLHFVTPAWVERTVVLGMRQEPNGYSPHAAMLFSGVVATTSDLSATDNEIIAAGIGSLGGQWRTALTKDVTHVFALASGSAKYETAMHFREATKMKVLVPHWFDDVVRLGCRSLPTEQYEWPDPKVFRAYGVEAAKATGAAAASAADDRETRRSKPPSTEKKILYDTALSTSSDLPPQRPASVDLWHGLKIMFGSTLNFKASQLEAHIADVERAGGEVILYDSAEEELENIEQADVYIARHRIGRVFVKAYQLNKTIGTLPWFWYVRATGTLTRPMDQLLHYPTPKRPIESFSRHIITVTNYTGKDREYLKKLMNAMGADFTPTMSGKNTVVIAAYTSGAKIAKAQSWGIPIVNHLWLEDCYAQWRDISPAHERYIDFPPGIDFGSLLADDGGRAGAGLAGGVSKGGRKGYDQAELDRMEKEAEEEVQADGTNGKVPEANKENVVTIAESPKRGILKKTARPLPEIISQSSKDPGEVPNAASSARPPTAKPRPEDDDVSMADVTRAYVDMDVPLDDDGRLSEPEFTMDVDKPPETPKRGRGRPRGSTSKGRSVTPTRKSPRTPSPGRALVPRTPQTKSAVPPSKLKSKSKTRPQDDDEDMDEEPSPVRPKKKLVKRFSSGEGASDGEERRVGRPLTRVAPRAADDGDIFAEGSSKKGTVIKTYGAKSRSRSRSRVRRDEDEEKPASRPRGRPRGSSLGKGKENAATRENEDAEMADASPEPPVKRKPGRPPKNPPRRKPALPIESESEVEVVEASDKRKGAETPKKREVGRRLSRGPAGEDTDEEVELTASPAKPRTPRRRASVLLPTLAEVRSELASSKPSSPERNAASKQNATKESPPKRGRQPKAKAKSPPPPPSRSPSPVAVPKAKVGKPTKAKVRSPSPAPVKPTPKPKGGRRSLAAPPEPGPSRVEETPTRRNAATKAAQKLHDEIMPDANNFAKELKSGNVKSGYEEQLKSAAKDKGKKRASLVEEEKDEEQDTKKRKTDAGAVPTTKRGRPRKSDVVTKADEEEDADAQAGKGAASKIDGRKIVVMTTQVVLSEDTMKAFQRLGAKFTTKPSECTHLVVRTIVRTEKFLCAIARAPYVLTDRWIETSVAKKMIMAEEDFLLQDHDNEKKWGCNLAETLTRAKANGGKLFAGKTFYVTPKVPVDAKLLRNVIAAGGGQHSTQTPTVRIVKGNDNRVVLSCQADISIWRPLAEAGHTIYAHELILSGMLRQEIEWDKFKLETKEL